MRWRCSLALALALIAGCSPTNHPPAFAAHTLTIADGFGDPTTLNPLLAASWPTSIVTDELALANFVRRGPHNRVEPFVLARIPSPANGDIQGDGKRIVFHLRPHLRWSDGAPLTADDVAFTVAAIQDPKNDALASGFDDIARVDVLDPLTIAFTLKRPYADFLTYYFGTDGFICLLPRHAFHGLDIEHSSFNARPIGAGPFRVVNWRRGDAIVFERNPYYYGAPANLAKIVYKLDNATQTVQTQFETGEVQLWGRIPESLIATAASVEGARIHEVKPDAYFHLDFNLSRMNDPTIRQAVRFALDRASIVRDVSRGRGRLQEGIISDDNALATTVPLVARNERAARALLAGRRPNLTLIYPIGDPEIAAMVEIVRSQLAQTGITVESKGMVTTAFLPPEGALGSKHWDLALFNWSFNTTADLDDLFGCNQMPPTGSNVVRYCDPTLQHLMDRFESSYREGDRRALLASEERIVDRDVPTIVLFMRTFGYATREPVGGFDPPADTPFDTFANVDVTGAPT